MFPKPRNPIDPLTLPELSDKPPGDDYHPKGRDTLVYIAGNRMSSQLERAFIRYCRFSRFLTVRAHAHTATLPDIKALCGDEVIWYSLQCLQRYGNDINMAQEAMEYFDNCLFDNALRLNVEQAKRLSQHISTNGFAMFPAMISKVFIEAERRRDYVRMRVPENITTLYYLINYYRMWKITFDGAKIMEKRFLKSVLRISDDEDREHWDELRFKNPDKLCPVCDKNYFSSGREGLLYCSECDEFFALIEDFRKLRKAVSTLPIEFHWKNLHCFEPMPRPMTPPMVSHTRRSQSLPRQSPEDWTISKAKRFARDASRKRRASRRLAPSICEDDIPHPEPVSPTTSASTETIPALDEAGPDTALGKINALFAPCEQNSAEVQATYNSLLIRYRQLNPTLADIEKKFLGEGPLNWNAVETYKHYNYLRAKAKLLCLDINGNESSVEISNAFAKVFKDADPDIYAWAMNAIQTGDIPEPAKSPWINERNKDGVKKFIMPPEYEAAAKKAMAMKKAGLSSLENMFHHRMAF